MKKSFLFFIFAFLLTGCSLFESSESQMGKSVDELVSEGASAFMAEDYKAAVKAYTDLKDWYPFSRYAILAELKIADSHFHLEEYEEAILAYEEFERMHPKNEAVPYVVFQIGMCWFNQIDTIDRDNLPASKSLEIFNRLIKQHPDSEYIKKAKDNIKVCLANLSGHELYVADWYMKTEQYAAALNRYEYLVKHYPDSKEAKQAIPKMARCKTLVQKSSE